MNAPDLDRARAAAVDFGAELARLDRLLEREIHRLRARYELSVDEFRGLYVSDERVDALLRRRDGPAGEALLAPLPAPPPAAGSRWAALAAALRLSRDELDLLLMALAPELDPRYEVLYGYLNDDVARRLPTIELAQRLFGDDAAARAAVRGRLAPQAPLLALGVLEFAAAAREAPRSLRGLRAPAVLADWLLGLPWQDERTGDLVRREPAAAAADAEADGAPGPPLLRQAFVRADDAAAPVLVLVAASAADAAIAVGRAAAGAPLLRLDLGALRATPEPMQAVHAVLLMQSLHGAALLATPLEALADADGRPLEASCAALRRLAARARPLLLAGARGTRWRELLGDAAAHALELPLPDPDAGARAAGWRRALGAGAAAAVGDAAIGAVADRFALGAQRIEQAARHAADLARAEARPLAAPHLYAAARAVSVEPGAEVVHVVRQRFEWSDLVLPAALQQRLRDFVHAVELRPTVLDRWGFARPCGGQRGVRALFAGPSGTGKTMAAAIVARELGLELHRVELAAVMSKYIGETEKNLERAFAAARRANAILFVDEADALLGKRSEVKDAHDRYANVETAFLLQAMEDHDGVVIVATNLAQHIDPAFSRRMQYVLQFPLPDIADRERLWTSMLPAAAPRAADLDIGFLARQFDFAGGDIRNIVLDAAFRAADAGGAIGMRELLAAVVAHYGKRGQLPHANEFGRYAGLLRAGGAGAPR
jgi:hypothetical protein